MKKNAIKISIIIFVVLLIISVSAFHASAQTETSAAITETSAAITETSAAQAEPSESTGGIRDIIDIGNIDKTLAIQWLAMILIYFIFNCIIFKKFKDSKKAMDAVISVTNEMIGEYQSMQLVYEKLEKTFEDMSKKIEAYGGADEIRNRISGALLEQGTAILEILQFAYANSSKIPQAIKDMINLKYSNLLKKLGNDTELAEIIEKLKKEINSAGNEGSDE